MNDIFEDYFELLNDRINHVIRTQKENIYDAAKVCASSIFTGNLVFTFGTGHGAFPALEMFPRTGTVTGFRPIVESTMISFHHVFGDMGARQYRFIHGQEGYGRAILSSHQLKSEDAVIIFSHSGLNAVTLDVALGAQEKGLKVIGVTSVTHSSSTPSRHSSGKRLFELADIVIDTGAPKDDAGMYIDGLEPPVGATSTSVAIAIGHAINVATSRELIILGYKPMIMVNPNTSSREEANHQNDLNYKDLWKRLSSR